MLGNWFPRKPRTNLREWPNGRGVLVMGPAMSARQTGWESGVRLFGGECKRPERAIARRSELGGVAAQEERTIDRPMAVEKFSMGGRGVILCDR